MTSAATNRGKTLESSQLGGVIRDQRLAAGITLAALSRETGLSQSFLSQLENGRTNTSLRSLQSIADALGTTATVLLADSDTDTDPIVRGDDEMMTISDAPGALVRSLVRGKRQLRALEFTGEAHDDREFTHGHDEIMYVVSGQAQARLTLPGGDVEQTLGAGDCLYVEAGTPHRWKALDEKTRVVLFGVADDMVVRRTTRRVKG